MSITGSDESQESWEFLPASWRLKSAIYYTGELVDRWTKLETKIRLITGTVVVDAIFAIGLATAAAMGYFTFGTMWLFLILIASALWSFYCHLIVTIQAVRIAPVKSN